MRAAASAPPPIACLAPSPAECCESVVVPITASSPALLTSPVRKQHAAHAHAAHVHAPVAAAARAKALACFLAVALLTCSYSLLLQLSKDAATGRFRYSPLSVTFVAEAAKLLFSVTAVYGTPAAAAAAPPLRAADCARAAVPALLYCAQNNLVFAAMAHLDPPLYQLLSNLKIVATALLTRVVLHRALTRLQARAHAGRCVRRLRRCEFQKPKPLLARARAPLWRASAACVLQTCA
jgi:hypothetical protein